MPLADAKLDAQMPNSMLSHSASLPIGHPVENYSGNWTSSQGTYNGSGGRLQLVGEGLPGVGGDGQLGAVEVCDHEVPQQAGGAPPERMTWMVVLGCSATSARR